MPELRKDPISDRWVVISTERGRRPSDFGTTSVAEEQAETKFCPFCEGHESKTPPEITAWRRAATPPNTAGWDVRVIPNKFPALIIEGEVNRTGMGIFDMMSGIGAHEVIVENSNHKLNIPDLPDDHVEKILWAYKQRIVDLEKDKRFRYILVFKNYGTAAGASLSHPHSQLIATPISPRYVKLNWPIRALISRKRSVAFFATWFARSWEPASGSFTKMNTLSCLRLSPRAFLLKPGCCRAGMNMVFRNSPMKKGFSLPVA